MRLPCSYPELLVATGSASLGHNNGIATNAALVMNNGTIDLNGYNQTVSAIGLYPGATSGIITNTNANLGGNSGAASGPNTSSVLTVNTSATAYPDSAPDIYAGNLNTHIQLVKTGAGTLSLTGTTNTYLGGTVIQQGVLAVSTLDNGSVQSPNSLGESYLGPSDLTFAAPGGTLRYAGTGATASTSRGFTISDNATATIDVSNATTVLTVNGSAAVDGTESTNPASFAKGPGVGTVILTGTYPYHGNTTVNGGTLVVNGTTGTAGYGSISIASGATLGGTGTLSGAFNHTAGTIVGGASLTLPTTGSLTFTDPVTLNGGTDLNNINSSALSTSGVNQQGYINASGGLTFGSIPETVSLQFVGTLPAGNYMYNLFDYSGTPVVTPNIVYTSNLGRATFTTDLTTTGQVNVNVSSGVASLFWNSTSSGTWDVALNASSGTANWYNTGTNAADKYYQGDSVTFADSGTTVGTGTLGTPLQTNITINTTVAPGSIAVTSNTSNYSFSGTGNISGSGTLTKSGSSTLTIATANTYTGNTTISGGTVILSNTTGSGLGTGSVTVGTGVTLSFLYAPSASLGNSSMVNNGTVNYNASGAGTLPVPMSGTGVFTVTGTGNVILSGANTYSGGTYVNAGLIYTAGNSSAFGGSSGGAVNINPGGEIYFNSAGGSYPNAFNLNQSGSSQTVLEAGGGGVSTISGPVNLTTASTLYVDGGVTLIFANTNALTSTNAGLTVGGGGGSSFGIGGNVSIGTGQLAVTAGSLQFTPPASTTITVPCVITGTAAVTQTGPGETVLSGSNTYTGGVNVNGGILQITNSAALGAATNQISIAGGVTTTAQLQLSGGSITVSGPILLGGRAGASANLAHIDSVSGNNFITGNISTTTGGNIYTLESDSGLLTVSGAWNASAGTGLRYYDLQGAGNGLFSGNISNGTAQVALTMQGTGTWTLSGSNAYTGGTNVASGTLVLKSAAAFPSATNLTVASGATLQISNHSTGSSASLVVVGQPTNGGTIDITNNAIDIQTITTGVSDISTINAEAAAAYNGGHWNGTSGTMGVITSTTAANDPMHLTAVGVATGLTSFELGTVASTDVLVKYTYYGDALLTGSVTSADYAKIDLGFLTNLTGWQNGDFNYDNVINGSDYTLIDNAFNMQGVNLATEIASPTAQIAGAGSSSVPEPASLMLIGMGALGLLGRRSCRRH
jgi:autotransporter-associated beta strand protein